MEAAVGGAGSPGPDRLGAGEAALLAVLHSSEDLLKLDSFIMSFGKVIPCTKSQPHDWSRCLFAHPTEAARRRDPRVHPHAGVMCPRVKKDGLCVLADACPCAHSVFEYWLHPTRYRTKMCKEGARCARWLCFFAHNPNELRVPSPSATDHLADASAASAAAAAAAVAAVSPGRGSGSMGSGGQTLGGGTAGKPGGLPSLGILQMAGGASAEPPALQPQLPHALQPQLLPPLPWQQQQQQVSSLQQFRHAEQQGWHSQYQQQQQQYQQQQQQQPQYQAAAPNSSQAVSTVLQMLERGEISTENSAVILRELLLPAQARSNLQLELSDSMAGLEACTAQDAHSRAPVHGTGGSAVPAAAAGWMGPGSLSPAGSSNAAGSSARGSLDLGWPLSPAVQPHPALSAVLPAMPAHDGPRRSLAALQLEHFATAHGAMLANMHQQQPMQPPGTAAAALLANMQQQQPMQPPGTAAAALLAGGRQAVLPPTGEAAVPWGAVGPLASLASAPSGAGGSADSQVLAALAGVRPGSRGSMESRGSMDLAAAQQAAHQAAHQAAKQGFLASRPGSRHASLDGGASQQAVQHAAQHAAQQAAQQVLLAALAGSASDHHSGQGNAGLGWPE